MQTKTIIMTPTEWALIPGNPRQRNTEERVKHAKHLFTPTPEHEVVKMAVLPDGGQFKIDGHTRDLFWQLHAETAPEVLLVVVYQARDLAEVLDLYDFCDSQAALETATDKVFGSFRELGFAPSSAFYRVGKITAALRTGLGVETGWRAEARAALSNVHGLVEHWLPEIRLVDEWNPNVTYFSGAVHTAALITLRRYKVAEFLYQRGAGTKTSSPLGGRPNERADTVCEFWERYARHDGNKHGRNVDAIEALRMLIDRHRETQKQKSTVMYLTSRAVGCVERHLIKRGYRIQDNGGVGIKGVDLSTYFPPAVAQDGQASVRAGLRKREPAVAEEAASLL